MSGHPAPRQDRLARFQADGFLFPVELLERAEAQEYATALRTYREITRRAGGLLRQRWNYPKIHLLTRWADALVHHEAAVDLAESLIGPDLLVWSTNIFERPEHSPARLAWHQDAPYYGWEGFEGRAIRVWIALTPTSRANGTMLYCRGSHAGGLVPHGFTGSSMGDLLQGERAAYEIAQEDVLSVDLEPGQCAVHTPATVHSSGPSTGETERLCFAVDYIDPAVRPLHGDDSALLVRGEDRHGHYVPERRPAADFAPEALRAFRAAVRMRDARLVAVMREAHAGRDARAGQAG
ncbi:ectoine hydroxylase-related dioxygenase (phytanoyl-CoA dioxygenase family) [Nonomuraea fuscirosea]|uniref:Ectoine hydroxylase-related dioxygenase (Phytanoyl-CoA dioxygenase family) n=1 Tax=Nonomuraea fuscirosea TaxID=1291556 RepID=A0A2T0N7G6_9ACTN|nr:phytanoyl-CoA dioxygenase family protein [Nonomuraea fuscirosea]PRX68478.1 ectoine hydroxylase-related dioxygenase (phytanoyl-CoA dioxygenase family) [Nonomuraea fuscirosea]